MPKIIIEVYRKSRVGHVRECYTFKKNSIKIGRDYDNDIILTDPHVSKKHLKIKVKDAKSWTVEDNKSVNGTTICKAKEGKFRQIAKSAILHSGDEMIIGRTRLKVISPSHKVAPAETLKVAGKMTSRMSGFYGVSISFVVAVLIILADQYLRLVETPNLMKLFAKSTGIVCFAIVWGVIWGIVGKVMHHDARFYRQCSIGILFIIAAVSIANLTRYLDYTNIVFLRLAGNFVYGVLVVLLIHHNMKNSMNLSKMHLIAIPNAIVWGAVIVLSAVYHFDKPKYDSAPVYSDVLKPPFAKIVPNQTVNEFLNKSAYLFEIKTDE